MAKTKYTKLVKTLYDGFTKIAEEKIKELTSKQLTDKGDELSVAEITNSSRDEKPVTTKGTTKLTKEATKNYFKNIEKNGVRSDKASTVDDIFINNIYKGTTPKIVAEDSASNKLNKRKKLRKKVRLSKKKATKPVSQK